MIKVLVLHVVGICIFCSLSCHQNPEIKNAGKLSGKLPDKKQISLSYIDTNGTTIMERFLVPKGFERITLEENTFGNYLRRISLKPNGTKVYAYDGTLVKNDGDYVAVLDIDVGSRDLQQCADAVMRLRGEYLYEQKRYDEIHFNFLSDSRPRYYKDYAAGDYSYAKFRKYMDYIFSYANTTSLSAELNRKSAADIMPGDVFIEAGRPIGHAVIVMDVVENPENGERLFLLAQSFMPAQSIHILVNYEEEGISPWYRNDFGEILSTPNWRFTAEMLKSFTNE